MKRAYLDWNATAPIRPEVRAAMVAACDLIGNPSSVHAEGRAAKMALERARDSVASALGAEGAEIVFTSGATEAAALALADGAFVCAAVEHDAIGAWCEKTLPVDSAGRVALTDPGRSVLQIANSETGVMQELPEGLAVSDLTQAFGKVPLAFHWSGIGAAIVSAHKLGGPKGVGALILKPGSDLVPRIRGGGQEHGRRSGTENLIGIVGFAAAAEAAQRDLSAGIQEKLSEMRDSLQSALEDAGPGTTFPGHAAERLPNTLCILTPGWKGETQVMQMDLAGFAVSAGSACSSGKVRASGTLRAMGVAEADAACAIRVSIGHDTTADELDRFASAWLKARARWQERHQKPG